MHEHKKPRHKRIDAVALINARRVSAKEFAKLVGELRADGFTDGQIVAAMAATRELISALR